MTKDIDEKKTASGKSVATFTLAVNRDYKNAEGNYDADFINCVVYEQRAETICKYVRKGDRFGVVGKIKSRSYENTNGNKVYVTEVVVEGFEFLENKKERTADAQFSVPDFEPIDDDEDMPF